MRNLTEIIFKNQYNDSISVLDNHGNSLTYRELYYNSIYNAKHIIEMSTSKNILVYSENVLQFTTALFAAWLCDKTIVLISTKLTCKEIEALAIFCESDTIIYPLPYDGIKPEIKNIIEIKQEKDNDDYFLSYIHNNNELAIILPTTGTTGNPKLVQLTHIGIFCETYALTQKFLTTPQTREVCIFPMSSVAGSIGQLIFMLSNGASLLMITGAFSVEKLSLAIDNYHPTIFPVTPTLFSIILNNSKISQKYINLLKTVVLCGEKVSDNSLVEWREKLPDVLICQTYGLSETTSSMVGGTADFMTPTGSVGKPLCNHTVAVLDDKGHIWYGKNKPGEIVVSGPSVTTGYYKNDVLSNECMHGQWFRTGDAGYIDDNGFVYITGRIKNIIIVGGQNVHAEEVEDFISKHPKVMDVMIYGCPNEITGESIVADIVPHKDCSLTKQEIYDFCKGELSFYKIPRLINLCDSIITSDVGKKRRTIR